MTLLTPINLIISSHSNYRYAGYRQFTWWIHKRLGRYVRKVIPACAVKAICAVYPNADGNYIGFRTPDESNSEVDLSCTVKTD